MDIASFSTNSSLLHCRSRRFWAEGAADVDAAGAAGACAAGAAPGFKGHDVSLFSLYHRRQF